MFKKCASLLKMNLKLTLSPRNSSIHSVSPPLMLPLKNQACSLFQTPQRHFQSKIHQSLTGGQDQETKTSSQSQDLANPTFPQNQNSEATIKILKTNTLERPLYTGPTVTDFKSRIKKRLPTIDKTAELFNLVTTSSRNSVFVMGPRRFGKSLNVSTVDAIFRQGLEWWKENCENFAITKTGYQFPVHPVLSFDFSGRTNVLELQEEIIDKLQSVIKTYELPDENLKVRIENYYKNGRPGIEVTSLLQSVIRLLSEKSGNGVVLLVDEYDYPILEVLQEVLNESDGSPTSKDLSNHPSVVELTEFLKKFFTQIKGYRITQLKFFYITGCIPLSHLGIFSGPNDVLVARKYPEYDKVIGYTKEEILNAFSNNIQKAALRMSENEATPAKNQEQHLKEMKDEILKIIEENYDGFIFRENQKDALYSPFAINSLFDSWQNPSNISKYPSFFGDSGSSALIWRLLKSMSVRERTKLYWILLDADDPEIPFTLSPARINENQKLESLYREIGRLGYYGGLFSVNREKSTNDRWCLKMTNKEMKEAFIAQFENFFGFEDCYGHLINHLIHEDYFNYFDILNEELQKLSAFPISTSEVKHKHEVEPYGHVLFAFFHERLGSFVCRHRDLTYSLGAKVECIKDRSVCLSRARPDCFILFDGLVPKKIEDDRTQEKKANEKTTTNKNKVSDENKKSDEKKIGGSNSAYKKICFNIEFRCQEKIQTALDEAKNDLDRKKVQLKEFRKQYSDMEDSEIIYIAGAFGQGVVKAAEFYRLEGENLVSFGKYTLEKPLEKF